MDDCNHYKKTVEDNRIFKFHIGFNVEFDEVRGRLPLLEKCFQRFSVRRVVILLCLEKRISITRLKTQPLLLVSMLVEILQRNLMKSLASGVIIAIDHGIRESLAGRFMGNQQIGRVLMKAGSVILLLHMRPNLSPLTKGRWINF